MIIVHQLVELVGGNAGFDEIADVVEGFGGQAAEFAHFLDFFGGFDDDGHIVFPNHFGNGLPEKQCFGRAFARPKLFQVALILFLFAVAAFAAQRDAVGAVFLRHDAAAGKQHECAEQHHAERGQRGSVDKHLVAQVNRSADIH